MLRTSIPPTILDRLLTAGSLRRFNNQAIIAQRGEDAHGFWIVNKGQIKVTRLDADGHIMLFDMVEAGQAFGELAYFQKIRRQVDAFAVGDTQLIWLGDAVIRKLLANDPEIAIILLESLSNQLYFTLNRLAATRLRSPLGKIAQFLYDAVTTHGPVIRMTQQDLADAIDVSRNTASASLTQLETDQIIEKGYGWLRIVKPESLKELTR